MLTFALDMLRRLFALSGRTAAEAIASQAPEKDAGEVIFRMRAWPRLPEKGRTAEVYRMLSVMSSRPVNRRWLLSRCGMAPKQLDALLQQWVTEGSIEVIDPARFARS